MIVIKDFKTIKKEDGESFNTLIVQGGVEPVKSQKTGKLYFTARKATVPTTFDQETCKSVIGTSFEGEIKKVMCDPYKYLIKDTGEEIELKHRWEFIDNNLDLIEKQVVSDSEIIQ